MLARKLCFEDTACSSILEVIPKVCGPELVACSTTTVTKCQAALRTLQAFPFFKPTCLCREPHVDPECNSFRDFLFDHPCVFVTRKEKDPYPVDALPTCNHALSVCQHRSDCIKLFDDFKLHCKVRDNKCRMENRSRCQASWSNLRLSPVFGCICPNNNMKRRCERIFGLINYNPCVEYFPQLAGHVTSFLSFLFFNSSSNLKHNVVHAFSTNSTFRTATGTDFLPPLEETHIALQFPEYNTGAPENASAAFQYGTANSIIRKPLVDAANGLEIYYNDVRKPISIITNKAALSKAVGTSSGSSAKKPTSNSGHRKYTSSMENSMYQVFEQDNQIFTSTCHTVMDSCNDNYHCRMAIAPILHHCDSSRCSRSSCMEALKGFYRRTNFNWNLEVAFCLCKKTDDKQDPCLVAQQRLQPTCAQKTDGAADPNCLTVAENCRENKECRSRLEYFEQACAIDSVTRQCSGPPSECRSAMLNILGTQLRTSCACKGTDVTQLYDCLGWQRILWLNPCVVEAQRDFNRKKTADRALLTTTTLAPTKPNIADNIIQYPVEQNTVRSYTEASIQTMDNPLVERIEPAIVPLTTSPPVRVTTIPPRYCVFQRQEFTDQYIKEGTFKRIYHEDESDCSEICKCGKSEELVCKTMCVDRMPCKSEFAYYNHAAPAYQAYRGRCLCYSGRFICMKPSPTDYNLPQGIFLFLGYSEADELQLKNHTEIVIHDIVHTLQEFIIKEAVNGTLCTLQLLNVTGENVIIAGKLSPEVVDYNMLSPKESLAKEKEECAQLFEIISNKINMHNQDFISHLLLSIFKMAEVEIKQIEQTSQSILHSANVALVVLLPILPILQVRVIAL